MAAGGISTAALTVRRRPAAVLFGLALGVADLGSLLLLLLGVQRLTAGDPAGVAIAVLARLGFLVALAALLPGLDALVADRGPGGPALESALAGARRDGPRLFVASLAAHAVALVLFVPLVLAAGTVVLGADAVGQATRRATGGADWSALTTVWGVVALAALPSLSLARFAVTFHDVAVLDRTAGPLRAWRGSLRAVLARPRRTARYALVRAGLLALPFPFALALAVGVGALAEALLGRPVYALGQGSFLVGYVLAAGLARPLLAARHRQAATALPLADDRSLPRPWPDRRTVLAGVLVLAAVAGGVGAVRVADAGPESPVPAAPATDGTEPETVLSAANARTAATDHRMVYRSWSYREGTWNRSFRTAITYDRSDRQVFVRRGWPSEARNGGYVGYAEEGRAATTVPGESGAVAEQFRVERLRGRWHVEVGPPEPYLESIADGYPAPALPWRVANRTDDHVVYALTDPVAIDRVDGMSVGFVPEANEESTHREGNAVRVALDRETGRLAWIRSRVVIEYRDGAGDLTAVRGSRVVVQFDQYERADARRPAALGPSPYATVWDAFAY